MSITAGTLRAALSFIIGAVLLFFGIQAWATTLDFLTHAMPATARVAGNQRYVDSKGNVSYCPLLSFRTHRGRVVTAQAPNVCQGSPFAHGTSMAIHYRADRPTSVEVDGFVGTWFNPVVFTGAGLLLVVVPVLYVRSKWRGARPRAAPTVRAGMDAAPQPLWAMSESKPLGEEYIARLLASSPSELARPSISHADLMERGAAVSATPDPAQGEHRPAALEDRVLASYRKGDYWRAMDDMKRLVESVEPHRDGPDRDRWETFYEFLAVWYVPHSEAMYHYVGGLLGAFLGDDEGALDELRRSIDAEPDYAPAHCAVGNAYRAKGDTDAALRAYQQSVRLDPTSAPAMYHIGLIYRQRREDKKARAYLDRAIAADPANDRYRAARDDLLTGLSGRLPVR